MPWCHDSNSGSLLFFFSFSFVCAYECAGVQAGGYVCNYSNFIALESIGWSLSESSWFSVLFFFLIFSPSFYYEILLYFLSLPWDSSVCCEDWKSGRIKKPQANSDQSSTLQFYFGKVFLIFCVILHIYRLLFLADSYIRWCIW